MEQTGRRGFNFIWKSGDSTLFVFFNVLKPAEPARDLKRPVKIVDELIKSFIFLLLLIIPLCQKKYPPHSVLRRLPK